MDNGLETSSKQRALTETLEIWSITGCGLWIKARFNQTSKEHRGLKGYLDYIRTFSMPTEL